MSRVFQRKQFALFLLVFQVSFIILFSLFAHFTDHALPDNVPLQVNGTTLTLLQAMEQRPHQRLISTDYPLFQDIHVLSLVGFGFIMAFMKRYGFAAVSVNLLLVAFASQWAMLVRGFLSEEFQTERRFLISIEELMIADLSCAPVLIAMGALIGRLTPVQFMIMAFIETAICTLVDHLFIKILHCNDGGRSLVTHAFGAYFGLACSLTSRRVRMISSRGTLKSVGDYETEYDEREGSHIDHYELFSMIGTLFMWIFFPSFNAAAQDPEDARFRAVINTYLSLMSCTCVTFLVSSLGRFNMLHIQSSTLAGGVAIGSVANAILFPWQSLAIGFLAGIISVLGYAYLQASPLLKSAFRISDTCGVHNLHGLPGLLAGICSIIMPLVYKPELYGTTLYEIYPYYEGGPKNGNRDALEQAGYQLLGMLIVIACAIVGGLFTGALLRWTAFNQMNDPTCAHAENASRGGFYYGDPHAEWKRAFEERELQLRLRNPHEDIY